MPDEPATAPVADSWLYHFPLLYRARKLYPVGCRWCRAALTFTSWGWVCRFCDVLESPDEGTS